MIRISSLLSVFAILCNLALVVMLFSAPPQSLLLVEAAGTATKTKTISISKDPPPLLNCHEFYYPINCSASSHFDEEASSVYSCNGISDKQVFFSNINESFREGTMNSYTGNGNGPHIIEFALAPGLNSVFPTVPTFNSLIYQQLYYWRDPSTSWKSQSITVYASNTSINMKTAGISATNPSLDSFVGAGTVKLITTITFTDAQLYTSDLQLFPLGETVAAHHVFLLIGRTRSSTDGYPGAATVAVLNQYTHRGLFCPPVSTVLPQSHASPLSSGGGDSSSSLSLGSILGGTFGSIIGFIALMSCIAFAIGNKNGGGGGSSGSNNTSNNNNNNNNNTNTSSGGNDDGWQWRQKNDGTWGQVQESDGWVREAGNMNQWQQDRV